MNLFHRMSSHFTSGFLSTIFFSTAFLTTALVAFSAQALEEQPANQGLDAFVDKLKETNNFQADFVQTLISAEQIELQRTEGHMVVAHPGKLRWQTRPPYEQLVISDGELLWVYDMDLDQVTLRNLGRSYKNTPALLLSGDKAEIERNYRVNRIASGTQQELYELTPLDQSQLFTQLEFTYNGDNLTEMRILDATGQQTRIEFSNLLLNQSLDSYAFVFDVPEGADVIDARNGF